jgi:hypothetical protein
MSKRRKLAYGLALLGMAITLAIFAFLEITDYTPMQPTMLTATLILCPPAVFSAGFLDIEPHSVESAMAWLVIGAINAALYGVIGHFIGKHIWNSDAQRTS